MDRRRRTGRAGGRASVSRPVAAVIPPPTLVVPATAAAARERGPTQDELFNRLWNQPFENRSEAAQAKGYKWFPLPAKAPTVEGSFFKFGKNNRIFELADILLKSLYENDWNDVGDHRRRILHFLARSRKPNEDGLRDLEDELARLMAKVHKELQYILENTGYSVDLPEHFTKFPALEE